MCRGMIFWPENSHADTLMLEYFTANSWTPSHLEIRPFITEFCRRRYQRKRKEMERIWQELLPLIQLGYWRWNQQRECEVYPDYAFTLAHSPQHLCDLTPQTLERNRFLSLELKPHLKHAAETLRLGNRDHNGSFRLPGRSRSGKNSRRACLQLRIRRPDTDDGGMAQRSMRSGCSHGTP